MLKIGIDLDNTIIDYNPIFKKYLNKKEVFKSASYKETLKKKLIINKNSELKWMQIQGKAYGKLINDAKIFEGFISFLSLARYYKVKIYIVSHKTIIGHYDKSKVNLRNVALGFLKKNLKYKGHNYFNHIESIKFLDNFRDKIKFINSNKFDYFIDDLPKVIKTINLNKKILFSPYQNLSLKNCYNLSHWDQITKLIFSNINSNYYKKIINLITKFNIIKIKKIKSNRNSIVFQLINFDKEKYFLKIYPHRKKIMNTSIDRETICLNTLKKMKITNVPTLYICNKEFNFIITSWLYGKKINNLDNFYLNSLYNFIFNIYKNTKKLKKNDFSSIPLAKDSVLEFEDLVRDIEKRLDRFRFNKDILPYEIKKIILEVEILFKHLVSKNNNYIKKNKIKFKVEMNKQFLSPSDMGQHNSIFKNKVYSFYDFEYFGRDDPVKLLCDIILNPNTFKEKMLLNKFFIKFVNLFGDKKFIIRYKVTFRLHLLKWILIVLKKFSETDHRQSFNKNNIQFIKSRNYLNEFNNFNSTLNLFSDIN